MNNKYLLGAVALTAGIAVAVPVAVNAYQGDSSVQGPNYAEERHEAMITAFENNDYHAWAELMNGKGRITEVITEDNFGEYAAAHLNGDTSEIRAQFGLGQRDGSGQGRYGNGAGQGNGQGRNK